MSMEYNVINYDAFLRHWTLFGLASASSSLSSASPPTASAATPSTASSIDEVCVASFHRSPDIN